MLKVIYKNNEDGRIDKEEYKSVKDLMKEISDFLYNAWGGGDDFKFLPELREDKKGNIWINCERWGNHHIWIVKNYKGSALDFMVETEMDEISFHLDILGGSKNVR